MRGIAVDHYTYLAQEKIYTRVFESVKNHPKLALSVAVISPVLLTAARNLTAPVESAVCLGVNLVGSPFSKTCRSDVKDSLIRLVLRVMRFVSSLLLLFQDLMQRAMFIFIPKDKLLQVIYEDYRLCKYAQYLVAEYRTDTIYNQLRLSELKDPDKRSIYEKKYDKSRKIVDFYLENGWKARRKTADN